jgi:hypothetical protein
LEWLFIDRQAGYNTAPSKSATNYCCD